MTMYHHGLGEYKEAVSAAAKRARLKMEQQIEAGRVSALKVIEAVETQQPTDYITAESNFEFAPNPSAGIVGRQPLTLTIPKMGKKELHKHAVAQAADDAEIPQKYVNHLILQGEWGRALLAENLNKGFHYDVKNPRHLVRVVGDVAKGILSDVFRRIDSRPILAAFVEKCQQIGALPIDGDVYETKVRMKAILPVVFEPVQDDPILIGLSWGNSDFGAGAETMRLFIRRVWCTNDAQREEGFRQVHLGRRLPDDFAFSQETYRLDTKAFASATRDVVGKLLGPATVNLIMEEIKSANEAKLDPKRVPVILGALGLTKTERETITEKYASADVEEVPPGQTVWRLSNAISWAAGNVDRSDERKHDLQIMAGEVLKQIAA